MKDIDAVKRVRSWRNRHVIWDEIISDKYGELDILKSDFIEFNFKTGEGYPGYKQGELEYIDYQNPVNLWTTLQK